MKVDKMKVAFYVCIAITVACLFWVFVSEGKLGDEALEEVDKLRMEHYGHGASLYCPEHMEAGYGIVYEWWSITFEDGTLFVETQDGTWFIEMQRKEE